MSWIEYIPQCCAIVVALLLTVIASLEYVWHGLILALYPVLPGITMDSEPQDSTWKGPRKVTLQRRSNGFGFTLRHFIVYPPESAVAELNRLQETGGDGPKAKSRISALEPMDTIFVKQVKSDGPAHQAGLANGDRIVSVNGESVTGKTYQQVVNLIQLCDTNLTLFVVPREEDILQVAYPSSAYKAVNPPSKQTDQSSTLPQDQGRKDTNPSSTLSSISDDNDVVVVGKGVECEDTESVKERSDISYLTDSPACNVSEHRSQTKFLTSTPNSDVYRNEKNERKVVDSRQQYKVQRVTASTINHESSGPMKVTLVNPSSGESSQGSKEQRTFRLTNVINSQSKQPNNLAALESVSDTPEQPNPQPQRHVASLKSYYEAAKLANSSQVSNEPAETSKTSTTRGHSSSVDNLLSSSGYSPAQAVLRIQPQRGMNGSSSCDDLCNSVSRSEVGRLNRQVSIINGQSVQRTEEDSTDGAMHTWKNEQESVKVSRSSLPKTSLRVDEPDVSHEASLKGEEYSTHATRVTVSSSVSADNLSQNARNINVSPKREPRRATVNHDSKNIPSVSSNALVPMSRSQTLASGRVVHLSNQHQLLPDKPQDSKVYWDKKPSSTEHVDELNLTVSDGSLFSWKRTGSRRGSCDSDGSGGKAATNSQGKTKPPVPKRDSSRGRVRERSLEREKQREKTMHERHRSRSYDRAHQRTNWSQFQACRKNATGAVPEGIQLDDGTLIPPGRKDSSASSNSAGSAGEKDTKLFPAFKFKIWRTRSGSFDVTQDRPRTRSDSGFFRYGSWSAKRGSGGKIREKFTGGSTRRLMQWKEGVSGRQRLVRRTSYLKATGSDGEEEEHGDSGSVTSSQEGDRPSREKITPKRNASIRKLKSFFGEGTPKIVEAQQTRRQSMVDLLGSGPVAKEGPLNIKLAPNRSWKPVWAVLKGQVNKLFLMKEQRDPSQHLGLLDQPISLNGSNVDIAYDYTKKKKNVIRLTSVSGTTYLIQVSDTETMLAWIKVIQENNDPQEGEKENNLLQLLDKPNKGETQPTPQGKVPSPSSYRKKFFKSVTSPGTQPKPRPTAKEEMLAKAKASQSFADRMKRHIRGRGRTGGYPYPLDDPMIGNATFGVPLEECASSQSNELVPMVIEICCSIVEAKGMDIVGIYRVPGNSGGISYLKEELKKGVDEIDLTDERWQDVNVISSLLKLFFRKLPNPLVPNNQYKEFIAANRLEEPSERMWALRRQIHNLPDHHYESFKYLANHLKGVANNADVNRMEVRNLAIVFGPTLVRSGDDSMVTMVTDMSDQCKIVESLILHCDWFFSDDVESQQDVPSDAMRLNSWEKKKGSRRRGEDEEDGGGHREEENEMDKTGPLKTSSMEDVHLGVRSLFSSKDLILSVNTAAQRKLKSPNKPYSPDKMDTSEVKYRRPSPEPPQLHTIKLHDQESLRLAVGQQPITIDVGDERSLLAAGIRKDDNSSKVILRQNSHGSTDSKSSSGNEENPKEMEAMFQGSLFGSSNRSYQRSYYQNFQFGSTRGRKLSDSSETSQSLNLEQELKSLTNATKTETKRDSWVQSDYSKERERIERQHAEALKDLEKEDNTNIEELFKSRDYLSELAAVSNKIMDYTSKGVESPSSSRKHSLEKSSGRGQSKSSNNNNAFVANTAPKEESTKKQPNESFTSSLHIDESDFVQSMKATFEERLQRVLHHESEDDSSRPTSLVSEKDTHHYPDEPRGIHYRSNSVDRSEVLRRRLESPASSRSSSNTNSPVRSKDGSKSAKSNVTKSPHSPKKCSRIEVILTMEKREATPTSLRDNITNNAQEFSKTRRGSAKDTASIKEKNREKRHRRHTVGGGKDMQKAVSEHLANEESKKISAVDRLKPFGKENLKSTSKPQDIKSWLESERHRSTNSSPNLVSTVQASIARLHAPETDKQRKEKELRRKSTPVLGTTDFNNEPHKLSRMPRYFEIESYL
ncbi:rho GTPase-activating protein 21-like isoform X1 [Lytechinus pictus]|uniref:rho GTPase-activating protein 21-like isoform X1 n=1 Tax=Lytechinus pictus TaxID=7653 RepID=UPI0030B9BD82